MGARRVLERRGLGARVVLEPPQTINRQRKTRAGTRTRRSQKPVTGPGNPGKAPRPTDDPGALPRPAPSARRCFAVWTPACSVDASLGRQPRLPPVEGRQEVGTSGLHSEGSVACPLMSLPCCPWVPGGSAPHTRQRPQQGASAAGAAGAVLREHRWKEGAPLEIASFYFICGRQVAPSAFNVPAYLFLKKEEAAFEGMCPWLERKAQSLTWMPSGPLPARRLPAPEQVLAVQGGAGPWGSPGSHPGSATGGPRGLAPQHGGTPC